MIGVDVNDGLVPAKQRAPQAELTPAQARAAEARALQRNGRRMVIAGFVVSVIGVIAYCAVTFAAGVDANLGDILVTGALPLARATLGLLGLGTLVWLVGSFMVLKGAMDGDDEAAP